MAENVTIRFDATGVSGTVRQFQELESGLEKVRFAAQRLRTAGMALTAGLTVPLAAAGGAAIKAASDAQETANVFQQAFGEMSNEAQRLAENMAEALNFDISTIQQTMGVFQQMFTAMGIGADQALRMSEQLTRLQIDLASFFNLRPEVAFQKLQSGISGEIEPLRRLGILVDQQTIKQAALRQGIIETGEEMTQQQKVMARLAAIMEQTENVQGDFIRTQDEFANSWRQMREQIKTLAREFGEVLIPVAEDVIQTFTMLISRLTGASDATKRFTVVIGGVAVAAGPALVVLSQLTIAFTDLMAALGGVKAAFAFLGKGGLVAGSVLVILGVLAAAIKEIAFSADEAKQALKEMKQEVAGIDSPEQLRARAAPLRERQADLQEDRRRLEEELEFLRQQNAAQRLIAGKEAALSNVTENLREINNLLRPIDQKLRRMEQQAAQATAGQPSPDTQPAVAAAARFGAPVSLGAGGGAGVMAAQAQMQRRFRPIMTEAGTVMVDTLSDLREASAAGAESLQGLVRASDTGFRQVADVAITSMGQAVQAAITGFDNIASIVINTVTQIVQSLGRQGGPLAGFLGGFGVPIIGALGGVLGAIVSGGSDRPQPVEVKNRNPIPVEEQQDRGPETVIVQFPNPVTGDMERIEYELGRRSRRDATTRIPPGVDLSAAGV